MKPIRRILFFLLFISFSYVGAFAQETSSYFLHTIEKGQSLYSISSMYEVSQADIIKLNPGCEEKIVAGQTLRIPQKKETQRDETFHTIQPGETLYKLTTRYKISAKAICDANPGLSPENFRIGQVVRIPTEDIITPAVPQTTVSTVTEPAGPVKSRCKDMHKVKRKETIFSVSREYGITEEELKAANPELRDGMKKGTFLCIPYPTTHTLPAQGIDQNIAPPTDTELFRESKQQPKNIATIKAAIILPFTLDKRMTEYYEGFLIALDSLKRSGVSIDLHVYDSGSENASITPILAKEEMKKMDIIFGPLYQQHIKPLSAFAKKNDIRLVVPFSSKDSEVFNNASIYQINTPQSYLYSEVYEHFLRQFPNANVIVLESASIDKEKDEFIKGLKQELNRKGVSVKTLPEGASQEALKAALRSDKENIFIPTSGSNVTLIKILPQLTLLVRDNPTENIHLFGYPEWQTYTRDHLNSFFELDTYFYSSFYTNNLLPAAINFTNSYHKWYSKDMANSYPKFGMLGFDTGYFFLKGLSRYGTELEKNLPRMDLTPIQTGFKFQRVNNWGGFVNKKVFFVRFTKDFELVKLDFE
ncbi:PBP1 and LysM peptidoglycan-binding domain-containing protein [Bacteroides sp.]|uniref:PBP1 and LysM peptidoglycan-binding domain-containing protein n=1 Tax=Bacteroides sp. TaxID=29523 RepID=UPI002FCAFA32